MQVRHLANYQLEVLWKSVKLTFLSEQSVVMSGMFSIGWVGEYHIILVIKGFIKLGFKCKRSCYCVFVEVRLPSVNRLGLCVLDRQIIQLSKCHYYFTQE